MFAVARPEAVATMKEDLMDQLYNKVSCQLHKAPTLYGVRKLVEQNNMIVFFFFNILLG